MASTQYDGLRWNPKAHVAKYSEDVTRELTHILGYEPKAADFARFEVAPYDTAEAEGNLITTGGLGNLTNLIIGGGGDALTNAKMIMGVGNSSTAAAQAQTALQGTAYYQGVDASNPTRTTVNFTNDTIQAISSFTTGNANFAWNEWCWAVTTTGTITGNATLASVSSGTETMINRKVASLGTKASGTWVLTTTITLS